MNEAIRLMLKKYACKNERDYQNALQEIIQEIALIGLWRGKFFEKAAFYGGTALRILYGLDRFSEDLDFSLLKSDLSFDLEYYHPFVKQELSSYGFEVSIEKKTKNIQTNIESTFIKAGTKKELIKIEVPTSISKNVQKNSVIKIKFEVDIDPPLGFQTESKAILVPSPFSVNTFQLPDLFAGKLAAVLFRKWKNRVKGRDWYDLIWYVSQNTPARIEHLRQRIIQIGQTGQTGAGDLTADQIRKLLVQKVGEVDFDVAKEDVVNFIKEPKRLDGWSRDFFLELVQKVRYC